MKKEMTLPLLILFILIFISSCNKTEEFPVLSPSYEGQCGEVIPGIINVKFKEGYDLSTPEKTSNIISSLDSTSTPSNELVMPKRIDKPFFVPKDPKHKQIQEQIGLNRWVRLTLPPTSNLQAELAKWSARPEVEKVELEYYPCLLATPNDVRFGVQWYHNNTGHNFVSLDSTPDADMDTNEAWDIQKGERILIAVPDTSIFWHHEDLINNIWQNLGEDADGDGKTIQPNGTEYIYYNLINGSLANRSYTKYIFDPDDINGIDDDDWDNDPSTYIDDFIGWDFMSNDNNPIYESSDSLEYQWHGTQTAGCAASTTNNSLGLAGSCWNCEVMAMRRGLNNPYAMQYAVENGAKIISMSWISSYTGQMEDVLDYANSLGIILLAGAGNFASDTGGLYNGLCFNENIICVTGSTMWDTAWKDSSYIYSSGKFSDFGAPSAGIFAATPYNHALSIYVYSDGTSLGTPLVAGIVALMISENPNLTPDEVKSILLSSTDHYVSVTNNRFAGNGRINAEKAVKKATVSRSFGSYPISILDEYNSYFLADKFMVFGKATSPNFVKYEVYQSDGHYSEEWTLINESYSPVENGLIYSLNTNQLPLGYGRIKVIVFDSNNQSSEDITDYEIEYHPPIVDYLINLNEGLNIISLPIEGDIMSNSLNSKMVLGYDPGYWQKDLMYREGDEFLLSPWKGYIIFSDINQDITVQGTPSQDPTFDTWHWSLLSFNRTTSFADIFALLPWTEIYNITLENNSLFFESLTPEDNLTKGKVYWIFPINQELG